MDHSMEESHSMEIKSKNDIRSRAAMWIRVSAGNKMTHLEGFIKRKLIERDYLQKCRQVKIINLKMWWGTKNYQKQKINTTSKCKGSSWQKAVTIGQYHPQLWKGTCLMGGGAAEKWSHCRKRTGPEEAEEMNTLTFFFLPFFLLLCWHTHCPNPSRS